MKAALILTGKYIKKHLRQCVGIVLCIALFSGGILAALLFRGSADATSRQRYLDRHGSYAAVVYGADLEKLEENRELLEQDACAVIGVLGSVQVEDVNPADYPYLGRMDETAMRLAGVPLLSGRLPENSEEIAVEESTLYKLRLEETLGQTVTLTVTTPEGTLVKQYRLVGITKDYIGRMSLSDTQRLGIQGIGEPIQLPGVFVGGAEGELQSANVLCSAKEQMHLFGGHPLENLYYQTEDPTQIAEMQKANAITLFLILLFTAVIVIGVYNVAELSVKARERYIGVMRCVGMTKGQAFLLLFYQGIGLLVCSLLLGAALGVGFLYGALGLLNTLGQTYLARIDASAFLFFAILVCASVLLAFLIQGVKLRKKAPLEYGKPRAKPSKKKHDFTNQLSVLWSDATARTYRHQNRLSILLTAVCVMIAVFGSFLAEQIPREMYQSSLNYYQNIDYDLGIYGGVASKTSFYTIFPRNIGITPAGLERIKETEGLEVEYASIELTSKHFLLIPEQTDSAFLRQAKEENFFENDLTPFVIQEVGGKAGDSLAEARSLMGIDAGTLEALKSTVKEGEIHPQAFFDGKEIITTAPNLKVGDELTVITVLLPEGSTQEKINGEITVIPRQVRVSAVLDPKKIPEPQKKILQNPYLLMSSGPILREDPLAKYDTIYIRYTGEDKNSEKSLRAEKVVKQVAAQSKGAKLINSIQDKRDLQKDMQFYRNNCLAIVGFLLVVILLTLFLTTQIKVNTSLRSYLLMRAVGLDLPTLRRLLAWEVTRLNIRGILIGGVAGFAACTILAKRSFLPTLDIFLKTLLPVYLLVGLVIVLIGVAVAFLTAKKLLKKSVAKFLSDVDY